MKVNVDLQPFRLPNFLLFNVRDTDNGQVDVGALSDDEADAYFEEMRGAWKNHVRNRRLLMTTLSPFSL